MVGHGGSSAGSYLADPTSPIPSHCASIVVTSTLRVNQSIKSAQDFTRSLKERWSWIWVRTRICGCMSLLLPKLPMLPRQCYSNEPANLNNLGINNEIQPEFMCEFYHHISLNEIPRKQIQENKSSKRFFAYIKHTKRHSEKQKDFVKWTLTYLLPVWTTEC